MLLLSGEGIREVLDFLGPVLIHVGVEWVRDFVDERVDLLYDTTALLHLINLHLRAPAPPNAIVINPHLGVYRAKRRVEVS